MEMELNKRKIDFYDSMYETGVIHEENSELIIPDSSPDMVRIISSGGRAFVKDKEVLEGKVVLTGAINGWVLYMAEGEKIIRKLDVQLPFTHRFESVDINNDMQCISCAELVSLEAREINSRKIVLRAHIAIDIKCYLKKSMEITESIEKNELCNVEVKNNAADFYVPIFVKEKSFSIIDDIEIPKTHSDFETMLKSNVELSCTDKKIIGNKAVLKGVADIKYTYIAKDGTMNTVAHNLPFSQIMDIDELEEECDLTVKMCVRASEIEPAHDMTGDTRYIAVNVLVDTTLMAYMKNKVSIVSDLYSTSHAISAQFKELPVCEIKEEKNYRTSVCEEIETANSVKKILETNITLSPVRKNREKLENDIQIQVVYMGEDGEIYSTMRRSKSECKLDTLIDEKVICEVSCSGENASGNGNQISVRFFVDYNIKILKQNKVSNLQSLSSGEKMQKDSDEANVIIKHVYNEQPLWDIAKKYNTTVDEIAAANCLDFCETVAAGSMLLIPCGK